MKRNKEMESKEVKRKGGGRKIEYGTRGMGI